MNNNQYAIDKRTGELLHITEFNTDLNWYSVYFKYANGHESPTYLIHADLIIIITEEQVHSPLFQLVLYLQTT